MSVDLTCKRCNGGGVCGRCWDALVAGRDRLRGEPTPTELIHQLHEALYGERSPARDASPSLVWQELLAEVRRRSAALGGQP